MTASQPTTLSTAQADETELIEAQPVATELVVKPTSGAVEGAVPPSKPEPAPRSSRRESVPLFLALVALLATLIGGGTLVIYRAERAVSAIASPGAGAGSGTLPLLLGFAVLLFIVTALGAWFLADARVQWRRERACARELASFDVLTGLPNRNLFFDRLERVHLHAARYQRCYGLILLDIDGFGGVNEQFGYGNGDVLLTRVGRMLTHSLRSSDTVARVGGDEFAVLLSEVNDRDAVAVLGRKVAAALGAPIRLPGGYAEISASLGMAVFPQHGGTVEDILHAADQALDRAKRDGRGLYQFAPAPEGG